MRRKQKNVAYGLEVHAFNRLVKTEMLLANDICFGPTPTYNDVQFHFDTITQASSVGFFDKAVIMHKRNLHPELPKAARRSAEHALGLTKRIVEGRGFFDRAGSRHTWSAFVKQVRESAAALRSGTADDLEMPLSRQTLALRSQSR